MTKQEGITPTVLKMREAGAAWRYIAQHLGVSVDTARRAGDPVYAEQRRLRNNLVRVHRRAQRAVGINIHAVDRRVTPHEAVVALASVPRDTRSFTSRILGDPLPGRSALDMKMQEKQP